MVWKITPEELLERNADGERNFAAPTAWLSDHRRHRLSFNYPVYLVLDSSTFLHQK